MDQLSFTPRGNDPSMRCKISDSYAFWRNSETLWADGTITGVHTEKVTYRTDSLEKNASSWLSIECNTNHFRFSPLFFSCHASRNSPIPNFYSPLYFAIVWSSLGITMPKHAQAASRFLKAGECRNHMATGHVMNRPWNFSKWKYFSR